MKTLKIVVAFLMELIIPKETPKGRKRIPMKEIFR